MQSTFRPFPLRLLVLTAATGLLLACEGDRQPTARFVRLNPERTGISFVNTITPTETHNFHTDAFIYNGAGVAAGDLNGDELPDIYLAGNMVSSRLYLNRGDMRFEDVTEVAGVGTDRWATGTSLVDIDGDGDLDIYVSVAGPEWLPAEQRANLLFLNEGDGTFTEAAARFGIADTGFTTHAVFLDYDLDGDLDLFLLGNSPGEFARGEAGAAGFGIQAANPDGFDQLYRNEGDGTFSNVSEEAGILRRLGYGLGAVAADLNRDGWPDLYVSNDITPNDVLYVNNGDGTFTDRAAEWLGHSSFAGMGLDIADFSNDTWPDIIQTDMMPEDLAARKRVSGSTTSAALENLRARGFFAQYNANTLQLSRGVTPGGQVIFSEIARLAGVAYTDWSWTALFVDLDNDGFKDLFVTNGYPKAVTDFDYQSNSRMARRLGGDRASRRMMQEMLDSLPGYRVSNYLYRNEGNLTFSNRTRAWGMDHPAYSYGAAAADLNNDGRLDLIVNNIDATASIYESLPAGGGLRHYLQVRLEGESPNRRGIGAKVTVTAGGTTQYVDHTPYRGFMSTVDDRLHFGLGGAATVDTLEVIWPDGRRQILTGLDGDRRITLRQRDASSREPPWEASEEMPDRTFEPLDAATGLLYHHEGGSAGFDRSFQPLLPYELSRQGPPLAVADVDGDGLDDLFVGGGSGSAGYLFVQRGDGGFTLSPHEQPWNADAEHDDWGAHFFDANGDGRADLYVASGAYQTTPTSPLLQDRLYLNVGDGRFERSPDGLPRMRTSTAAVRAGDFNEDGRPDLFVGGRLTPGAYPLPTRSYVLRNDGGRFADVTAEVAPQLLDPGGMVADALWLDVDGDGRVDLVTAGTWMPIAIHLNEGERLREATAKAGLPSLRGWWYRLAAGDLDGDGAPEIVAGNLGLNHSFTTSERSRFGVYAGDFDRDRTTDVIFTQEIDGTDYPYFGLALLGRAMDVLAARYLTFEGFASRSVEEIFGTDGLEGALQYQVDTFGSVLLRNDGDGRFTARLLPMLAQIAPVQGIAIYDVDGDGHRDLVVGGNLLHTEPNVAPADAGKGLWMRGDGRGGFQPVSPSRSGFLAPHDVRDLVILETPAGAVVVVANSRGPLQASRITR